MLHCRPYLRQTIDFPIKHDLNFFYSSTQLVSEWDETLVCGTWKEKAHCNVRLLWSLFNLRSESNKTEQMSKGISSCGLREFFFALAFDGYKKEPTFVAVNTFFFSCDQIQYKLIISNVRMVWILFYWCVWGHSVVMVNIFVVEGSENVKILKTPKNKFSRTTRCKISVTYQPYISNTVISDQWYPRHIVFNHQQMKLSSITLNSDNISHIDQEKWNEAQ